ncbi:MULTISPECIES: S1 family peptidase [unclassified Crossiella]|uniref:S1 family peptidase n=1 Tax=unclassified Crossiella TaxID=2620835 RepID=UPI001FFFA558|nr:MULTISPECIES: S1 family peptidase [unclassified Crossiella]MCK2239595.1 S1 family peptidase [Crossiella sp. S99.2]MCK2252290.1 S1 family peptidase [Crossiella sp. S99.1]
MPRSATARLGLVVSLALSAAAGLAPAAMADPVLSPGLLPAMRQDLGLTERQAVVRVRQEADASRLVPAAESAAGESLGGSWFDPGRGKLVVAVTDPAKAAAVRATGAEAVPVTHSAQVLDRAKTALDQLATAKQAPAEVAGWHVDPRGNTVVVNVVEGADSPALRGFLDRARAAGPVTVHRQGVRTPRTYAAGVVGGDPYYTGNVRCSIGFSVHGGFVTAGHCAGTGAQVNGWDRSWMGTFAGSSFPGNDYAFVRTGGGWWTVPVVLGWGTVPDALVRGSWVAPVGTSVCRSGSTTRWHCGQVLSHNETINYAQGAVHQMTGTSVCAEGGDSGGSFITGDQAQGVTSGGYGDCRGGGRTWFQPINEILSTYGLALHTA